MTGRTAVHSAQNSFSVTATARTLNLHPNTVKYRLDRWTQLTGWDPRVLRGLLNS
jgi:DNA-binding PucR family transcriptional regulator